MARINEKVCLVTGAGQGIGEGIACLLAEEGGRVIVSDRNVEAARTVAENIIQSGGSAVALGLDVSSESDWQEAVKMIDDQYQRLSVLVNNAGVELPARLEEISLSAWRETFSINVDSIFLGCKAMLELLKADSRASVINMSSVAGIVGIADQAAYNTSKGAVRHLTKSLAVEFATHGYNIRVNSVHPGCIDTPMLREVIEDWAQQERLGTDKKEEVKAALAAMHPLNRLGKVEDIAYGVLYLASDESAFMTGSELVIDGGWIAQ